MAGQGALEGFTILDFTRAIAGGWTTRLLADMGARIIKIEAPEIGDGIRYAGVEGHPEVQEAMLPTLGPMFVHNNAGKQAICLDLKKPESIEICKRLLERIDIVVENFTPHVMPGLGLGYEDVRAIQPEVVYCSISGYGREGPLAEMPSNDAVAQAMSGMAYLTEDAEGYPVQAGNGVADSMTATTAAVAILAAILHRERRGKGQHIDISLVDSIMASDGCAHPYYAMTRGAFRPKRGLRSHFLLSPWGIFKGPNERYFGMLSRWDRLCEMMGRPDLLDDPDFATAEARLRNRERVHAVIEEHFQSYESADALYEQMQRHKIAGGPVLSPWETQHHPQFEPREMVREVPYPNGTSLPTVATAFHFSETPIEVGRAPYIGEHNREILEEFLGLGDEEIARLYESGAMYRDEAVARLFAGRPPLGSLS